MKLNKTLESKLLENIFADYSLVTKGESNNGAFYTVKRGAEIRHIKIVDKQQEDEEGLDETALSELTRGSRYIAQLIEAGDLNERYGYLVFEYIAGKDLSKVSKLSHGQLEKLAEQITSAICDLWEKGVVHRDIKPGNIMLGDDGNFYLVDLGIGYFMETPNRNNTKSKGSKYYSSPEQFFASTDSRVEITFSSDLYSLGMVMFEKATGTHPKSSWSSKQNGYGELITQTEPPKIEAYVTDLPTTLIIFINKLLAVYKSDRFLSPAQALSLLKGESPQAVTIGKIFLHDTANNYSFIDPYLESDAKNKPDAIIVSVLQGDDRIKTLAKYGYAIIIDPVTYRLPHPQATSSNLKKKLGYKAKAIFDYNRINQSIEELIKSSLALQKKAALFILPYFAIESLDDPFLTTNKSVWSGGRKTAKEVDEFKKVYGGIVIPASVTKDDRSTDRFVNLILSKYDLDGYYLIFEAPDDKVTAIDSISFLKNQKKIVNAFASMGDVIVGHSDISYMLLGTSASLAYGWSNAKRRFIFDNELFGKMSGFMQKDYDPKLLYYIPQLLTLIKGEEELEALNTFAPTGTIDCGCAACKTLSPYDGKTPKKLDLASQHYFKSVVDQHMGIKSNPTAQSAELLQTARDLTLEIRKLSRNTTGNKLIPNHEAILSVVNN